MDEPINLSIEHVDRELYIYAWKDRTLGIGITDKGREDLDLILSPTEFQQLINFLKLHYPEMF